MSTKSPRELEADETAQKRAQWEQFSFNVDAPGMVEVTNESHDNPVEDQYDVTLDNVTDELMACKCPHYVYRALRYNRSERKNFRVLGRLAG
ncbi:MULTISPECIES: hypothetical protein [unclassified Haladaptatus]|uniref:hypothetical protein n=1 Tax=unclassified Haladaptatus TaxID=2622732 RepID=UPI00209C6ACD|nr:MULTISPECIES: hypothetical protein [unclassified Haladaptatus]MCO8245402.1 hypothetical protein [Haladaptatus sp. AB643]MCO8256866.1 hypothetical protein [Haladaptatus sp. AB618]